MKSMVLVLNVIVIFGLATLINVFVDAHHVCRDARA